MELRVWVTACLTSYRTASVNAFKDFRLSISPSALRRQQSLMGRDKLRGKDFQTLWKAYENQMDQVDDSLYEDQLEQSAALYAMDFVEKHRQNQHPDGPRRDDRH